MKYLVLLIIELRRHLEVIQKVNTYIKYIFEPRSTETPKELFSCKLTDSSLKLMLPMLLEDMQSQVEQLLNMPSLL